MWPVFYHMEKPSLWGALRNAALMVYLNPIFTLVIIISLIIVSAVSTALVAAWPLLTVSFFAVLATVSVLDRLNVPNYIAEYNTDNNELR